MHLPKSFLTVVFLLGGFGALSANPTFIGDRTFKMTAEDVNIRVTPSQSLVVGNYTFRATDRNLHLRNDYTATLALPVMLPTTADTFKKQLALAKPRFQLTTGKQTYPVIEENAGIVKLPKNMPALPQGWAWRVFVVCPLFLPEYNVLKITISYRQPHLPGPISAYLPILPGKVDPKAFRITFQPDAKVQLEPLSAYKKSGTKNPDTRSLSFIPKNFEFLQMKVK